LATLAYADIFDYPLTASEIWRFLISRRLVSSRQLAPLLKKLVSKRGFYFLSGRQMIVGKRQQRQEWSRPKLKIARRTAWWLRLLPTIKMVAVSGALAMENTSENDDIDLLIVSGAGRLWLTRLLTVLLVELVARRRRPGDRQAKDKICLNMFLDERHLAMPENERNLYTAHEVCQLKLLWDRSQTYQRFISQNQWVKKYLANWRA